MKILTKLPIILILLTLISCSKEVDIEANDQSGELEGEWIVKTYEYEGTTSSILQNDIWGTQFHGFGWNMDITMVFIKSPNEYSLNGSYFVDHFFTNRNGIESLYFGDLETTQLGSWERDGHIIELNIEGEHKRSFISELTDSNLTIAINSYRTETENDGTVTSIERTETYTLERSNN